MQETTTPLFLSTLDSIITASSSPLGSPTNSFISETAMIASKSLSTPSPVFADITTEITSPPQSSVKILSGLFKGLKINKETALKLVEKGYSAALDLAEKIVKETGISFREAHAIVGTTIKKLATKKTPLNDDAFNDLKETWREVRNEQIPINLPSIKDCFDPLKSIHGRKSLGSPNPIMIKETIEERKKILEDIKNRNKNRETKIEESEKILEEITQDLLKKHKSGLFKWSKK